MMLQVPFQLCGAYRHFGITLPSFEVFCLIVFFTFAISLVSGEDSGAIFNPYTPTTILRAGFCTDRISYDKSTGPCGIPLIVCHTSGRSGFNPCHVRRQPFFR
jgi:hypothetical protein